MPAPLGYPIQYRHEYIGLLAVPEPSLQPAPLTVLLRSLFLAAKLISLLPDDCTTPRKMEDLACGCLTSIADRLSQLAHKQPSSQASHKSPDEALRQQHICKQLVKLLAPMMSHARLLLEAACTANTELGQQQKPLLLCSSMVGWVCWLLYSGWCFPSWW